MKRLHLHVSVKDLDASIHFYRTLFAADPVVTDRDYEQPCCYAKSNKYWVTDPTGIAWETFHTLGRIPVYGEDTAVFNHGESIVPVDVPATGCCVPAGRAQTASCCSK